MDYHALMDHFVDISLYLHVVFWISIVFGWICHHQRTEHEKTSGFKKPSL